MVSGVTPLEKSTAAKVLAPFAAITPSRTGLALLAANALVAVVVVLAAGAGIWLERRQLIEQTHGNLLNLSVALAAQGEQVLASLDLALLGAAEALDAARLDDPALALRHHEALRARQALSPGVNALFVLDQQGRLVSTSRTPAREMTDLSDRTIFTAHRDTADAGLVVSEPVVGRVGFAQGQWTLNVSRRLNRPDGTFAGVVAASLPVERLTSHVAGLNLGRGGTVSLFRRDGIMLARHPILPEVMGRSFAQGALFTDNLKRSSSGTGYGRYSSDGIVRLSAYQTFRGGEFVILVATAEAEVLAEWRQRALLEAVATIAVLAALLFASLYMRRLLRAREALQEAHARRLSTAAMAEAEAKRHLEDIYVNIAEGFLAVDERWTITYANPRVAALVFATVPQLLGRGIWDVMADLVGTPAYNAAHHVMRTGEAAVTEHRGHRSGRVFEIRLYRNPFGLAVFITDITEQKQAAEQRQRAQRLEAIGQLTGGVAHDFNNLLTIILANGDQLMDRVRTEEVRHSVSMILQAAERGAELTRQLLAFARRQPLEPVPVDANGLLGRLEPMLRRTIDENVEIEFVRGAGLWPAIADPGQLEAAVLNLALNARDAMPEGGKLTIETANIRFDDAYAAGNDTPPGQYVMVAVSDTGTGMSEEVRLRAFEPFFTTKTAGRGTGMGLAMVYGFARQSGGNAKIYSEPGEGTTIKLYLPRSREAATMDPPVEPAARPGSERILLVEDDAAVRQTVLSALQRLGYQAQAAESGVAALKVLEAPGAPDFDLLLTDVIMPGGVNGRQLADRAKVLRPGLKVLFISGYTENAIVHQGRLDADVHLLAKPFTRDALARKLRLVLDGA